LPSGAHLRTCPEPEVARLKEELRAKEAELASQRHAFLDLTAVAAQLRVQLGNERDSAADWKGHHEREKARADRLERELASALNDRVCPHGVPLTERHCRVDRWGDVQTEIRR
jgi:hypothetical protein